MYSRTYSDSSSDDHYEQKRCDIPANYRGNAFVNDTLEERKDLPDGESNNDVQSCHANKCEKNERSDRRGCPACLECLQSKERSSGGLLSGLLSGLGRDIEFDDIILVGLIILILLEKKRGCSENSDEMLILLAFLLLGGF